MLVPTWKWVKRVNKKVTIKLNKGGSAKYYCQNIGEHLPGRPGGAQRTFFISPKVKSVYTILNILFEILYCFSAVEYSYFNLYLKSLSTYLLECKLNVGYIFNENTTVNLTLIFGLYVGIFK